MTTTQEVLSILEVREYASDYAPNNYLLPGEEFSPSFISICRDLAIDEFNIMPPVQQVDNTNFPSKSLLMQGTLWKMFDGKATLLARNTLSYSDGGLQIPVEERATLYADIAKGFRDQFFKSAQALKITINMNSGWSSVSGDAANFPLW